MDYHYQQLAAIQPNPELTPDQVVKIQLEGLQNNDLSRDNTGIRICFYVCLTRQQNHHWADLQFY